MVKSWPALLLGTMSGSVALQRGTILMSMAHVATKSDWDFPGLAYCLPHPNLGNTEELPHPQWHEHRRAGKMTNSGTNQAQSQTQSFELVYPNIYTIYEMLELVKGLVLQNQSYRISMTQGNNRISEKSSCGSSIDSEAEARGLKPDQ